MQTKLNTYVPSPELPARLKMEQVAEYLGFAQHDIPVLVARKRLTPLGNPTQNAVKYFDALQILRCANDANWLDRSTRESYEYWKRKNERRRPRKKDDAVVQAAFPA
jgi:hypothetical protein